VGLPQISNDLFWQNRAFHVEIVDSNGNPINGTSTANGTGLKSNQNIVALLPQFTQSYTGQCMTPPANQQLYWDLGVRMDLLPDQNGHALVFNTATVGAGSYAPGMGGGSGVTANLNDAGPIGLAASYSIFSDAVNTANVNPVGSVGNVTPSSTPVIGQYCNGARIPPEQCSAGQGANDPGMCKGYFTPAGQSETVGVAPVFVFNGIAASATVDEGNNWINLTYGPLTLGRPPVTGSGSTPSAEPTVASAAVGVAQGAYSISGDSAAVGAGNSHAPGTPSKDFYGQARPATAVSIGAVEYIPGAPTLTAISPASGQAGTAVPVTLTGTNFTVGSTVSAGSGVTVSAVTRVSSTEITATFTISALATLGDRAVSVTASGGTTGTQTFSITAAPPKPTLVSVTCGAIASVPNGCAGPTSLYRGDSVTMTLVGTGLTGGSVTVTGGGILGTGITVTGVQVNAAGTQLTATFAVAALSLPSARQVSVTTALGSSGTLPFSIVSPPALTFTQISPISGARGAAVPVTLTGTGFTQNGMSVTVGGSRVTVSNVTATSSTTITATFTIQSNAATGARTVTVINPNVQIATKTFTVN